VTIAGNGEQIGSVSAKYILTHYNYVKEQRDYYKSIVQTTYTN